MHWCFTTLYAFDNAQVAVAEPLVWRAVECVQRLDLRGAAAAAGGGSGRRVAAATDTPLAISLMAVADLTAYVRRAPRMRAIVRRRDPSAG